MPIDPVLPGGGAAEWSVPPLEGPQPGPATGFGSMLTKQIGRLQDTQAQAADAAQGLASGTATDPAAAVMAIERARLAMQLASQIRTKGVEALQSIYSTQV